MSDLIDQPDKTKAELVVESRVPYWHSEIEAARKREADFRKDGAHLTKMYEGGLADSVPFNILYSNTETLAPALYNNTPRPVVKPRYKKKDPNPKLAAAIAEAYLEYWVDSGDPDEPGFDDLMLSALHEALVPGRGCTRYRYKADVERDTSGAPSRVKSEYVCGEHVSYNRILHGYAKKWEEVPWVSFEHWMTLDEARKEFGKDGDTESERFPIMDTKGGDEEVKVEDAEGVDLCLIHEIWDRDSRKVLFLAEGGKIVLRETEDPLKLDGFFPCSRPLTFVTKISSLVPRALYALYENQAKELNRVTLRIQAIIAATKACGAYNSQIEGLDKILELEDGKLAPLENTAALGDGTGLDKAVWMWPVEKLVPVLQQLYLQRQQIKQVIYEITGISDILRGASVASETATAQQLKNQWGSLRIKRFQKEVARYVKENLSLIAELSFKKLGAGSLMAMSGTGLPTKAAWDAAKAEADAAIAQAQQSALMAPEGTPPQPPQIPPEIAAIVALPSFDDVHALLKSDITRQYLINIETNSTVDAEATEDRQNLTEFLGAMAQFFGGIGPLVENGTLPFDAAKEMLLAISRKFRLGRELDDQLSSMQQPQQPGGAAMEKVKKEAEALEKEREGFQDEIRKEKAKLQEDRFKLQMEAVKHKMQVMLDKMMLKVQDAQQQADMRIMQTELSTMLQVEGAQRQADEQISATKQQTQQATFAAGEESKRQVFSAKQRAEKAKQPAPKGAR